MKGFGYLERLSLAARWFLPQREAEEMIEDYRDMISEIGEGNAEETLGAPIKAVLAVADRGHGIRWHGAFLFMALCGAGPLFWQAVHSVWLPREILAAVLGAVVSLFYFGMGGRARMKRPAKACIAGMALFTLAVLGVIIYFTLHIELVLSWAPAAGRRTAGFLTGVAVFSALAGILGLVLARLYDGRWRALFLLGLTLSLLCGFVLSVLRSMDPFLDVTVWKEQLVLIRDCVLIVLIGFFTAGVGLC